MLLKILILMCDKINMSELECSVDGMDVILKLETSTLMSVLFPSNFRLWQQLKIHKIFRLATSKMSLVMLVISTNSYGFDFNTRFSIHNVFQELLFSMWVQSHVLPFSRTFSPVFLPSMLSWMWDQKIMP